MLTFGVISEGITDRVVLKNILAGYFGHDAVVVAIQPPEGAPGEPPPAGGWGLVFESLRAGLHRQALDYCDYIVIHIDTDVSEQKGYDVPWRQEGRELSVEELVGKVADKLGILIGAEYYAAHRERFVFAIAVHAIECWLLPVHYPDNRAAKIAGCLQAVNHALKLANHKLRLTDEEKDPRAYHEASRDFTKKKRLLQVHDKNPSLALFVRSLQAIAPPEAGE